MKKAVIFRVGKDAEEIEVDDRTWSLEKVLDASWLDIRIIEEGVAVASIDYHAEPSTSRRRGEPNRVLANLGWTAIGDFAVVGRGSDGRTRSLDESEVKRFKNAPWIKCSSTGFMELHGIGVFVSRRGNCGAIGLPPGHFWREFDSSKMSEIFFSHINCREDPDLMSAIDLMTLSSAVESSKYDWWITFTAKFKNKVIFDGEVPEEERFKMMSDVFSAAYWASSCEKK
jgi:hypothetical protein